DGVRLSKVRRLLVRRGVRVPYPTLHRFAAEALGFGRRAATDCGPGEEVQLDTGWMTLPAPDASGRRRTLPRLDLHPGAVALPLRLSHRRRPARRSAEI